jgi:phenylacetate-coenzyme A ligase PaaK-like adenylate-forming protein
MRDPRPCEADELLDLASRTDFYGGRVSATWKTTVRGWDALGLLPPTTREELVAEKLRTGCPYSGRRVKTRPAVVTLQLDYAERTPLYVGLDRMDLRGYVAALERSLRLLGVRPGDALALYEYGSSPVVYLASSLYVPYLRAGAADRLGCTVICNDGVANLSQRAVEILKYVRPRFLVIRDDCIEPFVAACAAEGLEVAKHTEAVVVTSNEGGLGRTEGLAQRLGVPVYRMPRSDVALFLGLECPECSCMHVPSDLYRVEALELDTLRPARPGQPGRLAITNIRSLGILSLRVLTSLHGTVIEGGCPRQAADARVRL